MNLTCRKCGGHNFATKPNTKNPNATDLYCTDCGAWQKFATKDEIRLYENKQTTISAKDKLIEILSRYFEIGDRDCYHLTEVKEALAIGTVSREDFIEFDEDTVELDKDNVEDLAEYIIKKCLMECLY